MGEHPCEIIETTVEVEETVEQALAAIARFREQLDEREAISSLERDTEVDVLLSTASEDSVPGAGCVGGVREDGVEERKDNWPSPSTETRSAEPYGRGPTNVGDVGPGVECEDLAALFQRRASGIINRSQAREKKWRERRDSRLRGDGFVHSVERNVLLKEARQETARKYNKLPEVAKKREAERVAEQNKSRLLETRERERERQRSRLKKRKARERGGGGGGGSGIGDPQR